MTDTKTDYVARVAAANPIELVLINYELAFDFIGEARRGGPGFDAWVQKAKNAVRTLIDGLNFKYTLAGDLYDLYSFCARTLNDVRSEKDAAKLADVEGVLRRLYESFEDAARSRAGGLEPVMENAQKIYAGLTYSNGRLDEYVHEDSARGFRA